MLKPVKVGEIRNSLPIKIKNKEPLFESVEILYPSRLNAMAIDPSKIAINEKSIYTPGEIVFSIKIYKKIKVKILNSEKLIISKRSKRKPLIKHTYLLMKKAIDFKKGFYIDIDNKKELRHVGLGSSGCLIAGVACAINEIFGNVIDKTNLVRYLAQNHGEEIDGNENFINPVQCIGGSAVSGVFSGGMHIIVGESSVIKSMKIPDSYKVVIGIPKDFKAPDSKLALEKELENIDRFVKCGEKFGEKIAYKILHQLLPAMDTQDLKRIGDVIFDYRYNMGSIENCSFLYPKLPVMANKLAYLKQRGFAPILSISSVGPAFFAITKNVKTCSEAFKKAGLKVLETEIENDSYKILSKETFELSKSNFAKNAKNFWNSRKEVEYFSKKEPSPYVKLNLNRIRNPKGKRALDLGCGGGRHSSLLAELGFDVYATDSNIGMIQETKRKLKKFYSAKELNSRLKLASFKKIPYPTNFFDVVISTGVFHQASSEKEYEQAIKETSRPLKKGGILITDIFSSKKNDSKLNFLNNKTALTNEGLIMTLLSKDEYVKMMEKFRLKSVDVPFEEDVVIDTGKRTLLRATFIKI